MNYIKRIKIENFQSHENSEFVFTSGLNVIIGPSDQGKSAVVRAIKWVLFNEPRGSDFIRSGTNSCRVEIEMDDGSRIIREKSSSKNRYTIFNVDGKTQTFEGFGNEVPVEVKALHRVSKIYIDADKTISLNIAEQLEPPFLLTETGSIKAKAIGRLTGAHIIDNAIRDCISDYKKEIQLQSRLKKEVQELEKKMVQYEDIESLEKNIERLGKNTDKLENIKNKYILINSYFEKYYRITKEIKSENEKIKQIGDIENVNIKNRELDEKVVRLKKLESLYLKHTTVNETIVKETNKTKRYNEINESQKNIEKVEEINIYKTKLEKIKKTYDTIETNIKEGKDYLKKVKDSIEKEVANYEKYLKSNSKCPFCFSIIDESSINRVLAHYKEEK